MLLAGIHRFRAEENKHDSGFCVAVEHLSDKSLVCIRMQLILTVVNRKLDEYDIRLYLYHLALRTDKSKHGGRSRKSRINVADVIVCSEGIVNVFMRQGGIAARFLRLSE